MASSNATPNTLPRGMETVGTARRIPMKSTSETRSQFVLAPCRKPRMGRPSTQAVSGPSRNAALLPGITISLSNRPMRSTKSRSELISVVRSARSWATPRPTRPAVNQKPVSACRNFSVAIRVMAVGSRPPTHAGRPNPWPPLSFERPTPRRRGAHSSTDHTSPSHTGFQRGAGGRGIWASFLPSLIGLEWHSSSLKRYSSCHEQACQAASRGLTGSHRGCGGRAQAVQKERLCVNDDRSHRRGGRLRRSNRLLPLQNQGGDSPVPRGKDESGDDHSGIRAFNGRPGGCVAFGCSRKDCPPHLRVVVGPLRSTPFSVPVR